MFFIARNISSTETQQYCSLLINFPLERWRKDVLVSYLTSLWENIHNVHKAHGHDHISIRMIKICDKSILKPLTINQFSKFNEIILLPRHMEKI